jgi:hypothetical protein
LGRWDEGVLEIVGGSREEGRRIRTWLGDVEIAGGRKAAHVSRYLSERFGFEAGEIRWLRCVCNFLMHSQILLLLHSLLITFLHIYPSVRLLETQCFHLDQWILFSHLRSIIYQPGFIVYSLTLPRMLVKSADTLPC